MSRREFKERIVLENISPMVILCQRAPLHVNTTIIRKTGVVARILKGSPIKIVMEQRSRQPKNRNKRGSFLADTGIRYHVKLPPIMDLAIFRRAVSRYFLLHGRFRPQMVTDSLPRKSALAGLIR